MEALRVHAEIENDGELTLTGLPWRKGQKLELIVLEDQPQSQASGAGTARDLLESGLVGIWKDRDDIGDSVEFARRLREEAQDRWRE